MHISAVTSVETPKRIVINKPIRVYEPKNAGTAEKIAAVIVNAQIITKYDLCGLTNRRSNSIMKITAVKMPQRNGPVSP